VCFEPPTSQVHCSKIAEAEAAVSVNEKKWLVPCRFIYREPCALSLLLLNLIAGPLKHLILRKR
jgi:hypothetical protein